MHRDREDRHFIVLVASWWVHDQVKQRDEEAVCSVRVYELNERYERSHLAEIVNSFLSFISYRFPKRRRRV
jgi:hypothetical protein